MEIKVTNLKTNETRKADMPQKTLLEIANNISNNYESYKNRSAAAAFIKAAAAGLF